MKKIKTCALVCNAMFFSACVSQPNIAKVNELESFKYENAFQEEYKTNVVSDFTNFNANQAEKWLQPLNKKEKCKILFYYDKRNDWTTSIKPYWDGDCKDGYAFGLGREFAKYDNGVVRQALTYYHGNENEPISFTNEIGNGFTGEGILLKGNKAFVVYPIVNEGGTDFSVHGFMLFLEEKDHVGYKYEFSPLSDLKIYSIIYPNYTQVFMDLSNDEFSNLNWNIFTIDNKAGKKTGYWINTPKEGINTVVEMKDNNRISSKNLLLDDKYYDFLDKTIQKIKENVSLAEKGYRQALAAKEEYKKRICKSNVKVTFMDNNKYKEICNENKRNAELKEKIDKELIKIAQLKNIKRQELAAKREHEMRIARKQAQIEAAKAQASAAAMSSLANAAKRFRQQSEMGLQQQMNNLNNTMQMMNNYRVLAPSQNNNWQNNYNQWQRNRAIRDGFDNLNRNLNEINSNMMRW